MPAINVPRIGRAAGLLPGSFIVLALQLGTNVPANADDPHLGIIEYEISCMPCHGVDGRGDGRMARTLNTAPADLTQIAKANNGKFPFNKVTEIIDGRAIVAAHGAREMPVWGDRYRKRVDPTESAATIEQRARTQIAALARYLESIQDK